MTGPSGVPATLCDPHRVHFLIRTVTRRRGWGSRRCHQCHSGVSQQVEWAPRFGDYQKVAGPWVALVERSPALGREVPRLEDSIEKIHGVWGPVAAFKSYVSGQDILH
ncbi:hypothetical protein AVEN_69911-1 [Araneus ventricosus]|uniref:Uncharacterized protein n=1 Tax=Araneus ventricosus TaxID=182803 RepID=A0A4Y2SHD8_ARAVE|nr:hypothetical protein AVEN_69911-1 [Araneus ventricosus]